MVWSVVHIILLLAVAITVVLWLLMDAMLMHVLLECVWLFSNVALLLLLLVEDFFLEAVIELIVLDVSRFVDIVQMLLLLLPWYLLQLFLLLFPLDRGWLSWIPARVSWTLLGGWRQISRVCIWVTGQGMAGLWNDVNAKAFGIATVAQAVTAGYRFKCAVHQLNRWRNVRRRWSRTGTGERTPVHIRTAVRVSRVHKVLLLLVGVRWTDTAAASIAVSVHVLSRRSTRWRMRGWQVRTESSMKSGRSGRLRARARTRKAVIVVVISASAERIASLSHRCGRLESLVWVEGVERLFIFHGLSRRLMAATLLRWLLLLTGRLTVAGPLLGWLLTVTRLPVRIGVVSTVPRPNGNSIGVNRRRWGLRRLYRAVGLRWWQRHRCRSRWRWCWWCWYRWRMASGSAFTLLSRNLSMQKLRNGRKSVEEQRKGAR